MDQIARLHKARQDLKERIQGWNTHLQGMIFDVDATVTAETDKGTTIGIYFMIRNAVRQLCVDGEAGPVPLIHAPDRIMLAALPMLPGLRAVLLEETKEAANKIEAALEQDPLLKLLGGWSPSEEPEEKE